MSRVTGTTRRSLIYKPICHIILGHRYSVRLQTSQTQNRRSSMVYSACADVVLQCVIAQNSRGYCVSLQSMVTDLAEAESTV